LSHPPSPPIDFVIGKDKRNEIDFQNTITRCTKTMTKQCSMCKQIKEASCFHKDSRAKDGLDMRCKPCLSEYNKKRREKRKKNRLEETDLPEGHKRCAKASCNQVLPISHFQSTRNRRTKL